MARPCAHLINERIAHSEHVSLECVRLVVQVAARHCLPQQVYVHDDVTTFRQLIDQRFLPSQRRPVNQENILGGSLPKTMVLFIMAFFAHNFYQ